ncbi:hypothetical protein [Streptomyces xanthophaeus]|uniref:hypothetical protein n=1 Tax=Streptomyces xanthophaeus TaxID=67385 RepID=UPI00233E9D4F|nr:hypothetical protein [Streptomyces xanthophaeus]
MPADEAGTAGPSGRHGQTRVPSWPPPDFDGSDVLIEEIVSAVRTGDDTTICRLLAILAARADIAALFRLRQRLLDDAPRPA